MGPMKAKSFKILDENQLKDEDILFNSEIVDVDDDDDDSDFDVEVLSGLENVRKESSSVYDSKNYIDNPQCYNQKVGDYNFVSEAEVRGCQEHDIKDISDILSISRAEASILLLHCNWKIDAVPEAWFTNGQKLREELGLLEFPTVGVETSDAQVVTCGICLGTFCKEFTAAAVCGHIFCKTCWQGVIKASLDGHVCLLLRCPYPSCSAAVGQDMINMLASDDDKKIYDHYFMRSYIEYNSKARWCPTPGCNYAVILVGDSNNSKVTCKCCNSFCWKCTKEHHQPISCAALRDWEMGSLAQPESRTIANTVDCPCCGLTVEVNDHFKRLECASCKFDFCKLCLASWLKHGFWKGDQYTHVCSEGKLKQPVIAEDEEKRIAQDSMIRFHEKQSHWKTHEMHLQAAIEEIRKLQNGVLKILADKQGQTEADMSFVREAWLQIADCKRFLKWACVYEYYLPNCQREKRCLFSYLLRGAEFVLEQLYQSASELTKFLNMDGPSAGFRNFRTCLFAQTSLAQNYFDNMAWAVENGVSNLNELRYAVPSRKSGFASASGKDNFARDPICIGLWNCVKCQFPNDALAFTCVMCGFRTTTK